MDLFQAEQMAVQLFKAHGLLKRGWTFEFDSSEKRFGCCFRQQSKITVSKALVELNSEAEVQDVILHEIAHALTPGHKHDDHWKVVCLAIGARPERCYNSQRVVPVPKRWTGRCPKCGNEIQTLYPKRRWHCRDCVYFESKERRVRVEYCCNSDNQFHWKEIVTVKGGKK